MVIHVFKCLKCGRVVEDSSAKEVHVCPDCGEEMAWDLSGQFATDGDYNFVSQSLAISPSQIETHKQLFPNVGVHQDGCLEFHSVKEHDRYLNRCGFVKVPQKIRHLATRQ